MADRDFTRRFPNSSWIDTEQLDRTFPLDLDYSNGLAQTLALQQLTRLGGNTDRARFSRFLHARRLVHRVAPDVILVFAMANDARDDGTYMHSDPHLPIGRQAKRGGDHVEPASHAVERRISHRRSQADRPHK